MSTWAAVAAITLLGIAGASAQPRQADGMPEGVPQVSGEIVPAVPSETPSERPTAPIVEAPRLECQPMPGFVTVEASGDLCVFRTERPIRERCACGDGYQEWFDFNAVRADSRSVPQWRSEVSGTCSPCPEPFR